MNKIIFLLSVVAGLLVPLAYAENNAGLATTQATPVPHRGTLYRIRHPRGTAWLFGTIHVGTPDFAPLGPEVTQAVVNASRIALELDVRDDAGFQSALQKHGMYPDNQTVDAHLSAGTLALLRMELNRAGIPFPNVARMKPWLLANLLVGLQLERAGYERQSGSESLLLALASSKPLHELESADYQMSLFDGMSSAEQEQYLREQLVELSGGDMLRKSRELIDAWANADGEAQERALRDTLQENTLSADFMRRTLLDKRNPEMAARIEALLKEGEDTFVAVGLLHLLGENSVPALLKQRGYEVEKVY
jgi:uncharacterized protein YbaP (TraB family)